MNHPCSRGITRRGFLLGAAVGAGVAAPLAWFGAKHLPHLFHARSPRPTDLKLAMPGPHPGRVVEVHHPRSLTAPRAPQTRRDNRQELIDRMLDQGIVKLTDGDRTDPLESWKKFFARDDVVGIKVNPVGMKANGNGDVVESISSPEIVLALVDRLKQIGIEPRNIIIFERYALEFLRAGYGEMMKANSMDGVRWFASAMEYTDTQLDIEGFDRKRDQFAHEVVKHVAGYDPDVFTVMGFCAPAHDPKDDRRFRSHLSTIVTKMVSKIITIPCLKDHRSAGVTLALKNLSHGMNSNVARSHVADVEYGFRGQSVLGPNQCNTFIPQAVSQQPLRQKATLHILDGLVGVYEGGPGPWNRTWGTWEQNSLFFATDPVAMDHVGWDIIDRKRAELNWPPVADMGLTHLQRDVHARSELAALGAGNAFGQATLHASAKHFRDGRRSEAFDLRTPQHVCLAGHLGLGVFDPTQIVHQKITVV